MQLAEPTTCDACGVSVNHLDLREIVRWSGESVYICACCREGSS